ncbi:MAG: hypothetical protein WCO84_01395 [bacterium]
MSGSAVTSVDFTGLNITKDDDYMLVSNVVNPLGSNCVYGLYMNNNNTNANYYSQYIVAVDTYLNSGRVNTADLTYVATATNPNLSYTNIKLTNSGYIARIINDTRKTGSGLTEFVTYASTSTFTATSITQITIIASVASGIGIGSRFQLYKCVATKVADITVGTTTTSVDITGLSIDKTSEYMLVSDFIPASATTPVAGIYANNNTTGINYYNQRIVASGAVTVASRNNASILTVADGGIKAFAITKIKLTNSGYFVWQSDISRGYGGANIDLFGYYGTSTFTMTSVTQLTIIANTASSIDAGSRFQLYKLK